MLVGKTLRFWTWFKKIETAIQTKESPDIPAINFHITNDHLGEGGAKAKFRANMDAIRVLKRIGV